MKILFVATKSPYPPVDGGRLLVANTLSALCEQGHEIDLVVPAGRSSVGAPQGARPAGLRVFEVMTRPRSRLSSLVLSTIHRRPYSIVRHFDSALQAAIEKRLATERYDVVHVEQLQALSSVEAAVAPRPPIVLRAQNVESDLWAAAGNFIRAPGAWTLRQARLLQRWEGRAVARVVTAVALTEADAATLRALSAGRGHVEVVPPPFPTVLPLASAGLAGEPAVVCMGSGGWPPNRDGLAWFLGEIWPAVSTRLPGAVLHVFQPWVRHRESDRVRWHRPPADSRECFPSAAVMVVPLRFGSGVRIRILESWARGVPVVATPVAAAGLKVNDGVELLLASTCEEFVHALERLHGEPSLGPNLVAAGRRRLASSHDPATVASRLTGIYRGEFIDKSSEIG